jgi:hypothetical protein
MPWSTFGGLRSYSSQAIAAHFRAIKGSLPFHLSRRERAGLGKLGDLENSYLDACPRVLEGMFFHQNSILGSNCSQMPCFRRMTLGHDDLLQADMEGHRGVGGSGQQKLYWIQTHQIRKKLAAVGCNLNSICFQRY